MSSADRVASGVNVFLEIMIILILDMIHALPIQFLDALPDFPVILIMIGVFVLGTPVAKICREDKQCMFIVKVRRKYLAVFFCHFFVDRASQDGNYFDLVADCLMDKRQVHFNAVFVLVVIDVKHKKALLFLQLVHNLDIDFKGSERGVVLVHIGESAAWEVFVMRGPEDEYPLDAVGPSYILVCPRCCWSAEIKTSMRSNQCLD